MTITVKTDIERSALQDLGQAVEAFRRACARVGYEAERNTKALGAGLWHPGFSNQTLIECASHQARYEALVQVARNFGLGDEITEVVKDPDAAWKIEVQE